MRYFSYLFLVLGVWSCSSDPAPGSDGTYSDLQDIEPRDTLIRIPFGEAYAFGSPCGYVNQAGDTIIPLGRYSHCFLDTATTFTMVVEQGKPVYESIAIDQQGNRLFDIYWYDNGPDYVIEGLFRIRRHGRIGYADPLGRVVIPAQFGCADPFENGRARVAYECRPVGGGEPGEHQEMESEEWFYIDREGRVVEE